MGVKIGGRDGGLVGRSDRIIGVMEEWRKGWRTV